MSVAQLRAAMLSAGGAGEDLSNDGTTPFPRGTTQTGLDRLIDLITGDEGLLRRISNDDIAAGASAADGLNRILLDAIAATGAANDGRISVSDLREISAWIRADPVRYERFVELNGDDEGAVETGFHLVQGDGGTTQLFEKDAVNSVMDGLYHIGFEIIGSNVANEDGQRNARLTDLSDWLNELLEGELLGGALANPEVVASHAPTTGTGLDRLVDVINTDPGLEGRLSLGEIRQAAEAADAMNGILLEAIRATGAAEAGEITMVGLRDISDWIGDNRAAEWEALHGADRDDGETGFHLVRGDGGDARLFNQRAIDTVADGIYHIGFAMQGHALLNEDGAKASYAPYVLDWLNDLLSDDFETGALTDPLDPILPDPVDLPERPESPDGSEYTEEVITAKAGAPLPERLYSQELPLSFAGQAGDFVDIADPGGAFNVPNATFALRFTPENVDGYNALFSKDDRGREAGEFTVWIADGQLRYTRESADNTRWWTISTEPLVAGEEHTLAISSGEGGLKIYLDGQLVRAEPEDTTSLLDNDAVLTLGGTRIWTTPERDAHSSYLYEGEIARFDMFAGELSPAQVRGHFGHLDEDLTDLMINEVFGQLDRGTDWLRETAADYGVSEHGMVLREIARKGGGDGDDVIRGTLGDDGINGGLGGDVLLGLDGDDFLQGGYGNDIIFGGAGNDVIDGGHGEDRSYGGDGDDLMVVRADGREPYVYPDPDRDEGDPDGELTNGKLYPDQPIPGDNYMEGGAGADIFYVQTLINAKEEFLIKHTQDDGSIRWNGVAGENDEIHDHWVDMVRLVTIGDFSKAEGDVLVIEGHTTNILDITYGDENGDGVLDYTYVELYSDQGNGGGAHNDDRLGAVKIFGDLLTEDDIRADAGPTYGIVRNIDRLGEAITPLEVSEDLPDFAAPEVLNHASVTALSVGLAPLFSLPGSFDFSGDREDFVDAGAPAALLLDAGTVTANFQLDAMPDNPWKTHEIFSKDAGGADEAGHMRMYLQGGRLWVEVETDGRREYLNSGDYGIEAARQYSVALTFDAAGGVALHLNGVKTDNRTDLGVSWAANAADLLVGASGASRTEADPERVGNFFEGTISDFEVHGRVLNRAEIAALNTSGALPAFGAGDPTAAGGQPDGAPGTGLVGEVFDVEKGFGSASQLDAHIAANAPTHTLAASRLSFRRGSDESLQQFLGAHGELLSGDGTVKMETIGFRFTGFIYIPPGEHEVTVASDDGFSLRLGGEMFSTFQGGRGFAPTSKSGDFAGGLYEIDLRYFENWGGEGLELSIDGEPVQMSSFYRSVADYEAALAEYGALPEPEPPADGPALTGTGLPGYDGGGGLSGEAFLSDKGWWAISDFVTQLEGGELTRSHSFTADTIDFAERARYAPVGDIIGQMGTLESGDATQPFEKIGLYFKGFIWIPEGSHRVTVRSDDGYLLRLGGEDFSSFESGRSIAATDKVASFEGGLYPIELFYYEGGWSQGLALEIDGEVLGANHYYRSVEQYQEALETHGEVPFGWAPAEPGIATTGTGLDALVETILTDPGLEERIDREEIEAGARAANVMNGIILEAITATGVANDGAISPSDMYDIADWIAANRYEAFVAAHGDDEGAAETGFHLVQGDGGNARLFAQAAVNTVLDGIYHAGFPILNGRHTNEDGNANARVSDTAYWLGDLLEDELASGALANPDAAPDVVGSTGTGLDQVVQLINDDPELQRRISNGERREGASAADELNGLIVQAIRETGAANDGRITTIDVHAINDWIRSDAGRLERFTALHGDDAEGVETGFHTVQNDGAITRLFGKNAVNTVVDGLFHIGFEIRNGVLLNEDGRANVAAEEVAFWLDTLLADELRPPTAVAPTAAPAPASPLAGTGDFGLPQGDTGTGLDDIVKMIVNDPELQRRVSYEDLKAGAAAANALNAMIVEGIRATGIANKGEISPGDLYLLSNWFQADPERFEAFKALHGDDAGAVETGFHRVQNDGAISRAFGHNGVNTVADGLYHIGFDIVGNRLRNEDGNANASTDSVAFWLNTYLAAELASGELRSTTADPDVAPSTGTGLDLLVDIINFDTELERTISAEDQRAGAEAADGINAMIVEAIVAQGLANDGAITGSDVYAVNEYIRTTYLEEFTALHGDDAPTGETGFHLVQGDGAATHLFGHNAVNTVADGVFHIGFEIQNGYLTNEDGARHASVEQVAEWLDQLLEDDLAASVPEPVEVAPVPAGTYADSGLEIPPPADEPLPGGLFDDAIV